jgi:hypothetical protein
MDKVEQEEKLRQEQSYFAKTKFGNPNGHMSPTKHFAIC